MSENVAAAVAPQPVAGPKDGLLGIVSVFVDPAATARRVTMRWFWIYPYVVMVAVGILLQPLMAPYQTKATEGMLRDRGMSAEQIQAATSNRRPVIGWIAAAVLPPIFVAITAGLIMVAASIAGTPTRYSHLFSLSMVMGLFYTLQQVAGYLVLRSRSPDDIQGMRDLQPPLGIDIFLHDLPKALQGIVSFFSIFEIWAIIMYALTFAAMARTSKGKAFFVTSPPWILGVIFSTVMAVLFM